MANEVTIQGPGNTSLNPYRNTVPSDDNLPVVKRGSTAMVEVESSRAVAEVVASMKVAMMRPRDLISSVDAILAECRKPSLAEKALYAYPKGGKEITGASIRLMETIAQCWGHIRAGVQELSREKGISYCRAFAWDMERNVYEEREFVVKHWRDRADGQGYAITDERDISEMIANMGSRKKRQCIKALIPFDVVKSAEAQCLRTATVSADVSPEGIKRVLDAFAKIGVSKHQIETRLGHRIDSIHPAEVVALRGIMQSIKDGMSGPEDYFKPSDVKVDTSKNDANSTNTETTKHADPDTSTETVVDKAKVVETVNSETGEVIQTNAEEQTSGSRGRRR